MLTFDIYRSSSSGMEAHLLSDSSYRAVSPTEQRVLVVFPTTKTFVALASKAKAEVRTEPGEER